MTSRIIVAIFAVLSLAFLAGCGGDDPTPAGPSVGGGNGIVGGGGGSTPTPAPPVSLAGEYCGRATNQIFDFGSGNLAGTFDVDYSVTLPREPRNGESLTISVAAGTDDPRSPGITAAWRCSSTQCDWNGTSPSTDGRRHRSQRETGRLTVYRDPPRMDVYSEIQIYETRRGRSDFWKFQVREATGLPPCDGRSSGGGGTGGGGGGTGGGGGGTGGSGDRSHLEAVYNATGGRSWATRTNWMSSQPIQSWYGVETDSGGRVTGLKLRDNNLTGRIPNAIRMLVRLEDLRLDGNDLTGPIPAWIGTLSSLRELWLNSNRLSGRIPDELGALSRLGHLSLDRNANLRGVIPERIGNLGRLWTLRLNHTSLSGPLPQTMTRLRSLSWLDVRATGLCAPSNTAFQSWLRTVTNVNGDVTTCSLDGGGSGGGGGRSYIPDIGDLVHQRRLPYGTRIQSRRRRRV